MKTITVAMGENMKQNENNWTSFRRWPKTAWALAVEGRARPSIISYAKNENKWTLASEDNWQLTSSFGRKLRTNWFQLWKKIENNWTIALKENWKPLNSCTGRKLKRLDSSHWRIVKTAGLGWWQLNYWTQLRPWKGVPVFHIPLIILKKYPISLK